MKYETEKDWCLRLYAFVGLGYLATYYVLAKFAAPLRWRDLCFFPAGCYEVVFSWQAVAAAAVSAVQTIIAPRMKPIYIFLLLFILFLLITLQEEIERSIDQHNKQE